MEGYLYLEGPGDLAVGDINAAVVPVVQAVLPENSGTTGPGTGRTYFKSHMSQPQRSQFVVLPQSGSTAREIRY